MTSPLENPSGSGKQLTAEPSDQHELEGLMRSGLTRLCYTQKASMVLESRFDITYNATRALCLAAPHAKGGRAKNRYIVFQALLLDAFKINLISRRPSQSIIGRRYA